MNGVSGDDPVGVNHELSPIGRPVATPARAASNNPRADYR